MTPVVTFPIHFRQTQIFRKMVAYMAQMGSSCPTAWADHLWITLWVDLTMNRLEGKPAGRMAEADMKTWLSGLEILGNKPKPIMHDELLKFLVEDAHFLILQDGTYICEVFAGINSGPVGRTVQQLGGDMKRYFKRKEAIDGQGAFQMALAVDSKKYSYGDGRPIDAKTIERINRIIMVVDNALYRETPRPDWAFTEALILDACDLVEAFTDERLDSMTEKIARHRNHAVLQGMTAEKLIPKLAAVASEL